MEKNLIKLAMFLQKETAISGSITASDGCDMAKPNNMFRIPSTHAEIPAWSTGNLY